MKAIILATTVGAAITLCATVAFADHNSKQGAGWANMPNDIHNTRVETLEANDNEAFREFVKYGEGSKSVNSLNPPDGGTARRAKEQQGESATEQARARQQAGTRENERVQEQRRIRIEGGTAASERQPSMRDRDAGYRSSRDVGDRSRSRGGRGRN